MSRRRVSLIARWCISAGLIVLLYSRVDFDSIRQSLVHLHVGPLIAVFPLLLLNTAISALKWRVLLRADGVRVPLRSLFVSYMIGSFFNVFLPSNIGGDSYRIYAVARATARAGSTVASVLADRLSGFLALSVLGFIFPLAGWELIEHRRMFLLPLAVFGLVVILMTTLCSPALLRLGLRLSGLNRLPRINRFADGFLAAVAAYRRQPGMLARTMGLSFCFHITFILCVWLLGRSLSIPLPFYAYCIYVPLVAIIEAVPLSVYGLGLRDAGYVLFMRAMDRPGEEGLALAVLFVAASLLYASSGGVLFALRRQETPAPSAPPPATEGPA